MQGKNKLRELENNPYVLQVQGIWYTIQGEGPSAGQASFFIRFTGCNLQCYYCDTHWNDEKDPYMDVLEILAKIDILRRDKPYEDVRLITLTGGEPTRQNLKLLIEGLVARDFTVDIETAGTFWQECFYLEKVRLIVSPKNEQVNPIAADNAYAFKYIVDELNKETELPRINPQKERGNLWQPYFKTKKERGNLWQPYFKTKQAPIYIQPCDQGDQATKNANARRVRDIVLENPSYRVSIQTHKIIGAK